MTTIEDEQIYDLAEVKFNYKGDNVRLVSSDGITVTYKLDTDDISDTASYYRVGTTIKKITIDCEVKGIVNVQKVRELVAGTVTDTDSSISIGVYNILPGKSPVIEDTLYDVVVEEIKVEKKEGNTCDIKCSAGYSTLFNSASLKA